MPNIQFLDPDSLGTLDRALFEHHPRQGVGVLVHRRPGRDGQSGKTPADFEGECAQVFANIGAALCLTGLGLSQHRRVHELSRALAGHREIRAIPRARISAPVSCGGYPTNTLLIVDRLVREEFLIEVSAVAAL